MNLKGIRHIVPLDHHSYESIRNEFITDAHRMFWAMAWFTGESPEMILSMDVLDAYLNPERRITREEILYPLIGKGEKRKNREVPLHQSLKAELEIYKPPASGFLFPSLSRKTGHLSRQAIDKSFRRAVKKAGLESEGYSLSSPRCGFINRLDELGVSLRIIQAITGCQSFAILQRQIEISAEKKRAAIEAF